MERLQKGTLEDAVKRVEKIAKTEYTFEYDRAMSETIPLLYKDFAPFGLSQAGIKFGFPAAFLEALEKENHEALANKIIATRVEDYFRKEHNPLIIRDFEGKHYGCLSNRYAFFDDTEVLQILEENPYLKSAEEVWSSITPEQLHLRFVSKNRLKVNGDNSDLSMAVFVDNSMVGKRSFTVRFGIYRWACTNGMIFGLKQFTLFKKRHFGAFQPDEIGEILSSTKEYEEMLLSMVEDMSVTKSSIYQLTEEQSMAYIRQKLAVGKKTACKIYNLYQAYGGESQWHLCNAITDYAHECKSIQERLRFEETALRVA